ncbi:adenylate cyclase, partial [bacterium (Candidatus Howlettbacteria) CG_4_10_14_3_um_filter_37_10]
MDQEFETHVLEINEEEIANKLRKLGAKEDSEVFQKRWVFNIGNTGESCKGEWIRLRQVGDKTELTYKNKSGKGMSETEEIEVEVSDFEKTAKLLSKLNCNGLYYQENKRRMFKLDGIEFTIDSWPMIPTYLEVEADNEEKVKEGIKLLGLEGKDSGHLGTLTIYKKYGIDLHSI